MTAEVAVLKRRVDAVEDSLEHTQEDLKVIRDQLTDVRVDVGSIKSVQKWILALLASIFVLLIEALL